MLNMKHLMLAAASMLVSSTTLAENPGKQPARNLHKEFEAARVQTSKSRMFYPQVTVEPKEAPFECMVERVFDGHALVSQPYDLKNEDALIKGGFRLAKSRESAGDHMRFGGRIFSVIAVEGDEKNWEKLVGQEVTARIRVDERGSKMLTQARVKK